MFGQYDGFVLWTCRFPGGGRDQPGGEQHRGLRAPGDHELIEAEDLNPILEQAKGITALLPGI